MTGTFSLLAIFFTTNCLIKWKAAKVPKKRLIWMIFWKKIKKKNSEDIFWEISNKLFHGIQSVYWLRIDCAYFQCKDWFFKGWFQIIVKSGEAQGDIKIIKKNQLFNNLLREWWSAGMSFSLRIVFFSWYSFVVNLDKYIQLKNSPKIHSMKQACSACLKTTNNDATFDENNDISVCTNDVLSFKI